MATKNRTILFVIMAFGLAACGGGESESSSTTEDTATDQPPQAAASPDAGTEDLTLPEGVTMAMVEDGESIFSGRGICVTCHGPDASGIPNLGGDLTDEEWIHSDGSYEGIVQTIMDGVTVDASTAGTPMPPKGGAAISDDQVKAVAAYVWTLSK